MQATFVQEGQSIDYTPGSAKSAGDVVVRGTRLVGITKSPIAASALGALAVTGVFDVVKDNSDISDGDPLYWDADGDPVGGTAGSGAFSSNAALGPFAGYALEAAGVGVGTVRMHLQSIDGQAAVARSNLTQDDLAVYGLDLETWRVTGTGALLGASAGTPSGAFGLTYGTHGTNAPQIVSQAASGASITNKMRRTFTLPPEYVAGQTVTLRVKAKETVGASTVGATIDAKVFEVAAEAGLGGSPTDLCATAAIAVTTTVGNKDFTITPTNLVPGDPLDIELTGVVNDTGGSVGTIMAIYDVSLLLDIKG